MSNNWSIQVGVPLVTMPTRILNCKLTKSIGKIISW